MFVETLLCLLPLWRPFRACCLVSGVVPLSLPAHCPLPRSLTPSWPGKVQGAQPGALKVSVVCFQASSCGVGGWTVGWCSGHQSLLSLWCGLGAAAGCPLAAPLRVLHPCSQPLWRWPGGWHPCTEAICGWPLSSGRLSPCGHGSLFPLLHLLLCPVAEMSAYGRAEGVDNWPWKKQTAAQSTRPCTVLVLLWVLSQSNWHSQALEGRRASRLLPGPGVL